MIALPSLPHTLAHSFLSSCTTELSLPESVFALPAWKTTPHASGLGEGIPLLGEMVQSPRGLPVSLLCGLSGLCLLVSFDSLTIIVKGAVICLGHSSLTVFLNLRTHDILGQIIVSCGGLTSALLDVNTPGLHPLDNLSALALPPVVTVRNISRYRQMSPGRQNHPQLKTISLESPPG